MKIIMTLITLALTLLLNSVTVYADNKADNFSSVLNQLTSKSFEDKSRAITALSNSGHEDTERLLSAILSGELYYIKKSKIIVNIKKVGSKYQLKDAMNQSDLGLVSKRKVKKISINNNLRRQLKVELTIIDLKNPNSTIRFDAVTRLISSATEDTIEKLIPIREKEKDPGVIDAIDSVIAMQGLKKDDIPTQLAAISQLEGNLIPAVLLELKKVVAKTQHREVKIAAQKVVKKIESRVTIFGYLETLFFGLSLGSILALAAIGLAITFGVMGVINMAHGELIMIGAYTTYVIQLLMPNSIGASILVAIPAAFIVSGLVGIAIERSVIRFLYGRPLETLLATFGISLFLQQAVRSIFSPLNRSVITPEWMSGSLQINSLLSITYNRLYIFVFCLIVFLLLFLVMKKTSLGLNVRAVSQNRKMARAMGIKSEWVDAMTFGLGSGIAGVAGVALSQITNVGPNLGQAYIVDSFMVVVFGGVGNLWGTLISGLSLGVVGKFLEPTTGAVLAKILVLIFIILFIQKRPRGLFPQKGRAADS